MNSKIDRSFPLSLINSVVEPSSLSSVEWASMAVSDLELHDLEVIALQVQQLIQAKMFRFRYKENVSRRTGETTHYLRLLQWGNRCVNIHLGKIPFVEGRRYQLTHRKSKTVRLLSGLGLERRDDCLYLKVQYLTPVREFQDYLFYGPIVLIDGLCSPNEAAPIFPEIDWQIDCLGLESELSSVVEEEAKELMTSLEAKYKFHVSRAQAKQLRGYLQDWSKLDQAVSIPVAFEYFKHDTGFGLRCEEVGMIEYDVLTQNLMIDSIFAVVTRLKQIVSLGFDSELSYELHLIAIDWNTWLIDLPQQNELELARHLFRL